MIAGYYLNPFAIVTGTLQGVREKVVVAEKILGFSFAYN